MAQCASVGTIRLQWTVPRSGLVSLTTTWRLDGQPHGRWEILKVELSSPYQQMPLAEEARKYVTINTHRGLYRFTRLPFGVASAPAIFQKAMDTLLQGLLNVICYLDDILVTGATKSICKIWGLSCRGCRMASVSISLSVVLCSQRSHTWGTRSMPVASSHLLTRWMLFNRPHHPRMWLSCILSWGSWTTMGKFMPDLATLLHSLNQLLSENQSWVWTPACDKAFQQAKEQLSRALVLVHYDPPLPIQLAGDASQYGIGVLSHAMPNGSKHPIAFASRTLHKAEKN